MTSGRPDRFRPGWLVAVVSTVVIIVSSVGLATSSAATPATPAATASASASASAWTVYHGNTKGTGVGAPVAKVDTSARAWTSRVLDGELYGEPLVSNGRVYVATENDTVYALSAATGAVLWSTHVASPVPSSLLPCGDIRPTVGITGTPVVDPARSEIFAVADELVGGKAAHVLVGLSTATGKVELSRDVDPAGAASTALLQRTGLTLDGGHVMFGYGGNDGDCASYRGRLVSVPETGGTPLFFTVDGAAGESQGAVWMGGAAPAVDAKGNVWVETGNGSVHSSTQPYDDSDAVLELSPSLRLEQYFTPASWATDNARDLDMSTEPVLLGDGDVLIAGKSRIAYLLNGAHLGGIGGQKASLGSICNEDVDGGSATVGTTVYLPCPAGTVAVRAVASPASLHVLWRSGSAGGPPIVAAGLVWIIGQNGTLYGLDPATGAVRQQATIGVPANHFPTPSVADGRLLAPSSDRVVAFAATSAGGATAAPPASAGTVPAVGGATVPHAADPAVTAQGGGMPPAAVIGIVLLGLVVIGGIAWFSWFLRRRRPDPARHTL